MSETASFVDPVFLARFGLSRVNVLDYFLHPLNPFRTKANTSNEVLGMQGIGIGTLMSQGVTYGGHGGNGGGPMSLREAEEEYRKALSRLTGEQYELLPDVTSISDEDNIPPSPLFTIRHVIRSNPTTSKVLAIYYVLEGVIYKAPSVRALMKANVTRTLEGVADASQALGVCARYQPSTGYTWQFEKDDDEEGDDPPELLKQHKRTKRRKVLDNRRPGERTAEEEEGIRASEAIDRILLRLVKSPLVVGGGGREDSVKSASNPSSQRNVP